MEVASYEYYIIMDCDSACSRAHCPAPEPRDRFDLWRRRDRQVTEQVSGLDRPIDFRTDPIELLPPGPDGWLGAKNTTLGADNGIGAAAALALLELPEDLAPGRPHVVAVH